MKRGTAHVIQFKNDMQKLVDEGGFSSVSISSPSVNDGKEIIIAQKKGKNMVKETVVGKYKVKKLLKYEAELMRLDNEIASLKEQL